ncbi:LOW QUALITY PROTEIN: transcription termination factor 5, mitochondrial-like, partial [Trichoplusia ni]|uniref:LOW QUALITY PROTEIN: transcription termination factor 5, mitochondrial-like n=1 Tax=Trichoplusia ni TaxID=7111 RepID=A0A7E5WXE9_TRINI
LFKVPWRKYHDIPFIDFYKKTTGHTISQDYLQVLKKRHPHIDEITQDRLQCTLQILEKFNITPEEACNNLHVFSMNPITMDNYAEILKECGFVTISPQHIIKYHTFVQHRKIIQLKKEGLLPPNMELEQFILDKFQEWPDSCKSLQKFPDSTSTILTIRVSILERFLHWKLSVTPEQFEKYCRNYLPLKHRPMSDIQEAISIAQNKIKFDNEGIKRNGFIISADPMHTKLILENVGSIAGLDICDALKKEPAILKNNYNSIIQVRNVLEEYRISDEAQRRCLKVFCMRPETVRERLEEFTNLKEYQVLKTNPRILFLVIHKKKMMNRLTKMQTAKKQCFSLNHLVSSTKIFENYISSFGDKVCGRDIAIIISSSLSKLPSVNNSVSLEQSILIQLRRHKYWLHVAMTSIDETLTFLKKKFDDQTIFNNCQIVLYPMSVVQHYIDNLLNKRKHKNDNDESNTDLHYNYLNIDSLTDDQILSLVLYEIEKKYHFSGDGIWSTQEAMKVNSQKELLNRANIKVSGLSIGNLYK